MPETSPELRLTPEERAALERGIAEFNAGRYFECHDTLEDLWSGLRGPWRDFFQGLIQVAVAFYHLENGNRAGAASLLEKALKRFAGYPPRCLGFDLEAQRTELSARLARLGAAPVGEGALDERPKWRFDFQDKG